MTDSNAPAVPLLDLRAQYQTIRDEIEIALAPVFESQHFVLGPAVAAFEEAIAAYLGCDHAIGCSSGSDALLLPLMALGIGPGDEVICPTFTFFATAGSVSRTGATPIFCDIDPATYNISADSLREKVAGAKNLKAIMPVHLYGQAADLDPIDQIAREAGVPVIEDAAQAIGTCDRAGEKIGSRGLIHAWSFYPTKNLGAAGEAGMVTCNGDDELADRVRRLRVHGGLNRYYHDMVGMNARLDAIQAAVLSAKLPHLDDWNNRRRANAAMYDEMFSSGGAVDSSHDWSEDALPLRYPNVASKREHHAYHQYVIRVPAEFRDDLRTHLTEHNIGNEVFYPLPLHLQECFRALGGKEGDCPVAERTVKEVIALPIYPELTQAQIERVAEAVLSFVQARSAAGV